MQRLIYYTLKKQRFKITQLEKECFIKVNEIKLTQVKLFLFFTLYVWMLNHFFLRIVEIY